VFLKLWSGDHRWFIAIRQAVCGGQQSVSEEKELQKLTDTERMKNTSIHVFAKTAFLVDVQQKAGELVLSISYCPSIIILETTFNLVHRKVWLL
jgi:hypothetical protein